MLTMAETIDLQKFVGTVIVVGIILVMGMFILSEIGDTTTNSETTNASENLVTALSNGTGWIAILVVVGFATIILTLLSSGLAESMKGTREQPIY